MAPEQWKRIPVPGLVTEEQFALLHELLQQQAPLARNTRRPSLLQGSLVCRECGYAYDRSSTRSPNGVLREYYRCSRSDSSGARKGVFATIAGSAGPRWTTAFGRSAAQRGGGVTELLDVDLRGQAPANERARVPAVKGADLEHVRARARDDMVRLLAAAGQQKAVEPKRKPAPIQASFEV